MSAFKKYGFLKMVHVHTGSQGLSLDVMVDAIKKVAAFAQEVGPQVSIFDVGGGLSVNFKSDDVSPTFASYSAALQAQVPMLFDGSCSVITEFGRSIVAKSGIFLSRVEYTKVAGGRFIIQQHCGHDLLVRTVWCPQVWPLRILVFNGSNGSLRTDDLVVTDVAGSFNIFAMLMRAEHHACVPQDPVAWQATLPPERWHCRARTKTTSLQFWMSVGTITLHTATTIYARHLLSTCSTSARAVSVWLELPPQSAKLWTSCSAYSSDCSESNGRKFANFQELASLPPYLHLIQIDARVAAPVL